MFSRPPQWLKWSDGLISGELLKKKKKKKQSFSLNSSEWVSGWETSARNVIGNRIGIFSLPSSRRDLKSPWSPFSLVFFFQLAYHVSAGHHEWSVSLRGNATDTAHYWDSCSFLTVEARRISRLRQNKSIVITFCGLYGFPGRVWRRRQLPGRITIVRYSCQSWAQKIRNTGSLKFRSIFSPPAASVSAFKRHLSCGGGPAGSVGWGRWSTARAGNTLRSRWRRTAAWAHKTPPLSPQRSGPAPAGRKRLQRGGVLTNDMRQNPAVAQKVDCVTTDNDYVY